jgi:hypothetical protein
VNEEGQLFHAAGAKEEDWVVFEVASEPRQAGR